MCWVQRKPFQGPNLGDDRVKMLQAKASRLEDFIKEKETELETLNSQISKVRQALESRLALMKNTPVDNTGQDTHSDTESVSSSSSEDSADLDDTAKYLKTRPDATQFAKMVEDAEDSRVEKLKSGLSDMLLYSGVKSGPFGRKKKPKKTPVQIKLADDEETLVFGANLAQKKTLTTLRLENLTVRYGKVSTLFSSGIRDDEWECFTLITQENNKPKEYDFVCTNANSLLVLITVVDALGGADDSQKRITRARFHWIRGYMKIQASKHKLADIVNKGVQSDASESDAATGE